MENSPLFQKGRWEGMRGMGGMGGNGGMGNIEEVIRGDHLEAAKQI